MLCSGLFVVDDLFYRIVDDLFYRFSDYLFYRIVDYLLLLLKLIFTYLIVGLVRNEPYYQKINDCAALK